MNEIYSFYSKYCSYVKRMLCSSKDLYKWYLEIDQYFFSDEKDFVIFPNYLDKNRLISPIIKTSNFSKLFQSQIIKSFGYYDEELIAY